MTLSFLNPTLLWGLLALAVPIIVHFFNLQRPKQFLFSNVAFVKEVKKTVVKRVQFQKWLLLLARLLALTALVLAFANPVLVGEGEKALQGRRSVAIVIDNSYSMTAGNERGTYLQQSVSLARNIFKAYSKEDEFILMTSSDLRLNNNFANQEEVIEELKELKTSQNIRAHTDILSFIPDIFARAQNRIQELYFLSDFQESTVMADSQVVVLDDSARLIKYLPLATREQKNVYVESNKILSQILEKNKPIEFSMQLVNDGQNQVRDLSARIVLEGKVAAISNTSLEANSQKQIELSFTPTQGGWLGGYIELDDNPVDFDNRRYFSLYIPEKEKVLVVENQSSPNIRILYESLFEQFDVQFVPSRNISAVQLNDYRSLVLLGVSEMSSGLADKIKKFLDGGGSVMFFPGSKMDLSSVNQLMASVKVGSFSSMIKIQEGSKASNTDLSHPLFKGIFLRDQKQREFDAPSVYQYYPLSLNNQSVQNRIISLENQAPILLESKVSNGLMFTFTLFPGDDWTDFHVKTIFTPLMFRATQIMNQTQIVQSGMEIGFFEPKSIRTQEKTLINLVHEDGTISAPEQFPQSGATVLNFEKMELEEGIYQLTQGGELLEKIAFNISDLESRLSFTSKNDLRSLLDQKGYQEIDILTPRIEEISDEIRTEKEGIPLWKYLIVFALLFLLAEVLILKFGDRTRSRNNNPGRNN
ncbi:MAG: BatA domain-containing protein [Bacteroidota bacterium]